MIKRNHRVQYSVTAIVFCLIPIFCFSQWTSIYLNPLFSFTRVCPLNKDTVFVIGDNGILLKSINSGIVWDQVIIPSTKRLFDIGFVNPMTGYICGAEGLVLKTIDGGNTWIQCITNTTLNLRCLSIANENNVWFGGSSSNDPMIFSADSGIIIKTINSGISFIVEQQFNLGVQNIRNFNADICLSICNNTATSSNNVYQTDNSGGSWNLVYNVLGEHPLTALVTFSSGQSLTSGGFGGLFGSNDFGNTWNFIPNFGLINVIELSFPSTTIGYAAGWDLYSSGSIVKTTNGGTNWELQKTGKFQSISFVNDTVGFSVTADGGIFKTNNGGTIVNIPPNSSIKSNDIFIFPNPFKNVLSIKIDIRTWEAYNKGFQYEVYSSTGQRIMKNKIKNIETKIDNWTSYFNGTYIIVIKYNNIIIHTNKIIKIY